jgi:ATP-dependent Clp protease ATP-binding subunit ClpA
MSSESRIEPALEAKLKRMRLRMELPDGDTLAVKRVPADQSCFNKARTNLLIKRAGEGLPCLVCVDEDLQYTGMDQALAHAFAAGCTRQGWLILAFAGSLHGDLTAALEYALDLLGAGEESGKAPETPAAARDGLLAAWAESLTDAVAAGRVNPTLCRGEEIEQVAACALGWQGRLPLILGEAGTGKTNLLCGAAGLLARRGRQVLAVNMGALMAGALFESEREALLASLLREARHSGAVLAMEQAEWAVAGVPRGLVLLREALDRGVRIIATSAPEHDSRFQVHPLASRLDVVRLKELGQGDTIQVLQSLRPSIAAHHRVEIGAEVELAAVERALSMEGSLPGKAVGLLDSAAARASLAGNSMVALIDVYLAASRMSAESA